MVNDEVFFITKTYDEYIKCLNGKNPLPTKYQPTVEKLESFKLKICNRGLLCIEEEFVHHEKVIVLYRIKETNTNLPKTMIKKKIPLDIARADYPECFV